MRIVIVGKTRMRGGVCVGGIVENTGAAVRLIPKGATCNPSNTRFNIGQVWDMNVEPRANATPPHVEDHDFLHPGGLVGEIEDLDEWLRENIEPWEGDRTELFGGTLEFRDNGTAYVNENGQIPDCSTGFWLLPQRLLYDPFIKESGDDPYYRMMGTNPIKFKYVGLLPNDQLPRILPRDTLVRLSLAHTWPGAHREEDRGKFFLQLSGWY